MLKGRMAESHGTYNLTNLGIKLLKIVVKVYIPHQQYNRVLSFHVLDNT